MENLGAIRKSKSAQCKFGSILVCMFFYVKNEFLSFGKLGWKTNISVVDIKRDKVNTQEPPSSIPLDTSAQPLVKTSKDTSAKVDTTIKVVMVE